MTYQSAEEFFCGKDLVQPTGDKFVRALCKKMGVSPKGVKATTYIKPTDLDVIAALRVSGPDAKQKVQAILNWFWDTPKQLGPHYKGNQMLRFHQVKDHVND